MAYYRLVSTITAAQSIKHKTNDTALERESVCVCVLCVVMRFWFWSRDSSFCVAPQILVACFKGLVVCFRFGGVLQVFLLCYRSLRHRGVGFSVEG